jgi:hypothetical protein
MPWTQAGAAVVVVAQQFNPSVFSQVWLVRHGVLAADGLLPGSAFTDLFVQVKSHQFNMLVIAEQLQFIPTVPPAEEQVLIVDKVSTIVRTLPHTPFKGLGLNFTWHLQPREGTVATVTRALFCREAVPLFRHFAGAESHFGSYLSKNFLGFRLKLDIKPILVPTGEGQIDNRVQFSFNFHVDLGDDAAQQIAERLVHWNDVRQEAQRIIDSVEARE